MKRTLGVGMTKLLGVALAAFLASGQIAGAISYEPHEDSLYNGSDRDESHLLAEIERLRQQAATKQELLNQSPVGLDQLQVLEFDEAAPAMPTMQSMTLMMAKTVRPLETDGTQPASADQGQSQVADSGEAGGANADAAGEQDKETGNAANSGSGEASVPPEPEASLNNAVAVVPLPAAGWFLGPATWMSRAPSRFSM